MGKSSMFVPVTIAILFVLGLLLMFNLTPGARNSGTAPDRGGNSIEAGVTLSPGATDPANPNDPTTPGVDNPSEPQTPAITEPAVTEPTAPPDTTLPDNETVTANQSFIYDTAESRFLYHEGRLDKHIFPASITKILTCHVLLKNMDPSTIVTVGSEITWIDPDSSKADLRQGDKLSVELLVYAMMLPSGNDAAYTTAVACGRVLAEDPNLDRSTAYSVFVQEMNAEAQLLGMKNSNFVTPDGNQNANHYTSMEDLVILINAAMENDIIRTAARTPKKDVSGVFGRSLTWYNSNALIRSEKTYYTPSAVGFKTGTTLAAGHCLIALFAEDDGYLIVGVFASDCDDDRYQDALKIYNCYHS